MSKQEKLAAQITELMAWRDRARAAGLPLVAEELSRQIMALDSAQPAPPSADARDAKAAIVKELLRMRDEAREHRNYSRRDALASAAHFVQNIDAAAAAGKEI